MTSTVDPVMWEKNAAEHADDRLFGPRDSAWWFTGIRPEDGCPGVGEDGRITSLPQPNLATCDRQAVLDYFNNGWTLQETLFAGLQGAEAFYRPPGHNLRHPMIFYYGHPAVLFVNKLRVSGLISKSADDYLEEILETGVDEMSWDDMSKNEMSWPSVSEVRAYRARVYELVLDVIESTPFAPDLGRPVTSDDQAWALFLAFEHERIHLETSSVLIRELRLRLVLRPDAWPLPAPMRRATEDGVPGPESTPDNHLVPIPGTTVRLGRSPAVPSFGWDNEYGSETHAVPGFDAARFLVSNGEFYQFVTDGGYRRPELWTEEGERWRRFTNTKWPRWWLPAGPSGLHAFRLRTTFDVIDMPWDWPACVNYHEAKAYCTWRAEKDGRDYRLPTEAEFFALRALPENPGVADDPVLASTGEQFRAQGVNLNLAWGSETPVDHSPATSAGVHDSAGNLWSWCEDVAHALDGFAVHPYYEDFSVPCFDDQHQMILGGCFISTGNEASIWARFHFRPHFLQQSGIRLIAATTTPKREDATHATPEMLARYLLMHFGSVEETFGRKDHPLAVAHGYPQRLARFLTDAAAKAGASLGRVLDVGCAVGGASFELARGGAQVVGIDLSGLFIETARELARGELVPYYRVDQGEVSTRQYARDTAGDGSVEFAVGDARTLSPALGTFDAVLLGNLLDQLADPAACLHQFAESDQFLGTGGLLLVSSPWSWQHAYTPPENWLGGRAGAPTSERDLRMLLGNAFDLVAEADLPGMLRGHARHFEYLDTDVSVWRKR